MKMALGVAVLHIFPRSQCCRLNHVTWSMQIPHQLYGKWKFSASELGRTRFRTVELSLKIIFSLASDHIKLVFSIQITTSLTEFLISKEVYWQKMLFGQTFMTFIFILLSQSNMLLDFRNFTGLSLKCEILNVQNASDYYAETTFLVMIQFDAGKVQIQSFFHSYNFLKEN